MELPKDLLVPILQGKVTAIFKLFGDRHELCGERNLSVSRRTYCVADILSTRKCTINDITEEDLKRGNFKNIEAFHKWWFSKGYHNNDLVNIVYFDILRYKPRGRWFLKKLGKKVPRIRGD